MLGTQGNTPTRHATIRHIRRVSQFVLLVLVALPVLTVARPAVGCSCLEVSPEEAIEYANQVFTGTLVQRTENSYTADNGVSLVFAVSKVYKGNVGEFTEVFTHAQSSACGLGVPPDLEVVILSQLWKGKQSVGACLSPSLPEVEGVLGLGDDPDATIAPPSSYQTSNRNQQNYVFAAVLTGVAAAAIVSAMLRLTERQSPH